MSIAVTYVGMGHQRPLVGWYVGSARSAADALDDARGKQTFRRRNAIGGALLEGKRLIRNE
jgi:hypothetical protein